MKKIIFLMSVSLLISLMVHSQKITPDKVSARVKQAFAEKFPGATNVRYEMEKKDYEINFKNKGVEMSANFDATGRWLETETEIKVSALPKEVADSVERNFSGFKIFEVAKTETPEMGIFYEMILKKDSELYEARFSPQGEMTKKTPLKTVKGKDDTY